MSTPQRALQTVTEEDYLVAERAAFERSEYLDGFVYAMAGESIAHGTISSNLGGMLYQKLRGTSCQHFSKDTKVRSGPLPMRARSTKGLYSYPDLVAVCGKPELLDEKQDVILNPSVIIEIVSPATEHFDRMEKWLRYQQWLPSLQHYLLVAQSQPLIEHYEHRADGQWTYTVAQGLESSLFIASLNCTLLLSEVYERVEFLSAEDDNEDDEAV